MARYCPEHRVGTPDRKGEPQYEEFNRTLTSRELKRAHDAAHEAGLCRMDRRNSG